MPDEERLQHALALASRYLNRRERTVSELKRHLELKGIDQPLAEEALSILSNEGYLDDARFARMFVQDKRTLEQWGADRIRRGLLTRGVDPELVAAALDEHVSGGEIDGADGAIQTELDRALEILGRRFPVPPHDRRHRDRALGLLIRKGYDPELALDALAAYGHED